MTFEAITRLRLREAFANIQKFSECNSDEDLLNELFEHSNKGTLFVHDDADKGHSVYVQDTKGLGRDKVFEAKNTKHRDVFLFHIDGVLFSKDSKCDCAVLTEKEMNFIEFKANAENNTPEAIETNYQKASDQLLQTINEVSQRCQTEGIELTDMVTTAAFAVFNRTVPRNDALRKKISAKFLRDTGTIKLQFANKTTLQ